MSLLDRLRKKDSGATEAPKKKVAKSSVGKTAVKAVAKPAAKTAKKSGVTTEKGSTLANSVLLRPIVTEKATLTGTYLFEVHPTTNKMEVKKAVQAAYGVTPKHVRIMNVQGKVMRFNNREGSRSAWKKAIVRLNPGETINLYEGV